MRHQAWRRNAALQTLGLLLVAVLGLRLAGDNARAFTDRAVEILGRGNGGSDFLTFYSAGQLYARDHDGSPYDLDELRAAQLADAPYLRTDAGWLEAGGVKPYKSPPWYLPLLGALAGFSFPVAFLLSTALQAGVYGMVLAITAATAARRAVPPAALAWVALALGYYHVWEGFQESQLPSYVVALAFAVGLALLGRGRPVWAGLALAFLSIKPQYLPAVALYLAVTRNWRALVGLALGGLGLGVASLALVGADGVRLFVESNVRLALAPRELYFANYPWMFNWRALLERALAARGPSLVGPAQVVLIVATWAVAAWAWARPAARGTWRRDLGVVVLALTMVLATPHVHGHDLVLLLPAAAGVAGWSWRERLPWPITLTSGLGLVLVFWLIPQQELLGPTIHASVLLLAGLFIASVAMLRLPAGILTLGSPRPAGAPPQAAVGAR
jgi:Glycosyltransferase family 87